MLNENIKAFRKAKGLSQEELAMKINVVRQTVSKWEQGLSVPDSDMLIALSDALETPVSALLGETVEESQANDLKSICEKLELINLQLAKQKSSRRKVLHWLMISLCAAIVVAAIILFGMGSPYLSWNMSDPETAIVGTAYHAFEWLFFRLAPFALAGTMVGIIVTREKR